MEIELKLALHSRHTMRIRRHPSFESNQARTTFTAQYLLRHSQT
jgi:hypothetical protein